MTRHALDNSRWGFASKCFVCEPTNDLGLRIPFFHDDDTGVVEADFQLADAFSGAPSLAHGGVTLAILDEAMAWATIAVAETFALTRTTTTTFERPVRIGRPYRVTARIEGHDEHGIRVTADVTSASTAKMCARADALFVPMDARQAEAAIGQEVTGADARFVRGDSPPSA